MPKSYGTVKMFATDKGFGFINVDGSRDSVFFHISAFKTHEQGFEPQQGLPVQFEMSEGKDKNGNTKPQAVKVTPSEDPVEDSAFLVTRERREYTPDRNQNQGGNQGRPAYGNGSNRGRSY